jgi:hypothetical protein
MNPATTDADKRIIDNMSRLQKNGGWQAEQSNEKHAAGISVVGKDGRKGSRIEVAQI